ncbi:MAG: PBP1A family penicillin-binding protein [Rhizobiales bacterium]|nr:PBP1A family penicillin-binding protein [Hyphomicrobiales bacterium]
MGTGGRKGGARREPNFDSGPAAAPAVQVEPRQRPAGDTPRRKSKRKKTTKKARRAWFSLARIRPGRFAYWMLVLALWGVIAGIGGVFWLGAHLPPIQSLEIPKRPPSIKIVDVNQQVLVVRGDMGGVPLTLKELPPYVPEAFIAIEDRRFYSHLGVDPLGIARAAVANLLHRGVAQGGSTLTQQLAKNLFLTQERTLQRKAQEVALALWLEWKYSKRQILELYLNRVYFGAGAWGIEQAAQRYFGKSAREISLAEAAMLAGLVKSPSRLAPTHNYSAALKREQIVLAAMQDAGFESAASIKIAQGQRPRVVTTANTGSVNYVADWILDALSDLIGTVDDDIVVQTTIDPVLQAAAEKALTEELAQKGDKYNVAQGALVSMTPEGAVRALVGGRNYADSQFNRAVVAKRQPGSAFKPFVYLTALERGLTPDTLREDRPVKIKGWQPENYTREYFGQVTLTKALAMSLNTVSVRLTQEFGPTAVVRTAHRLGIASKLEPNASIALGTSEVSVIELTAAYAPFANGGMAVTPYVVQRISDPKGKTLYAHDGQSLGRIIEPRYVGMMNTMLQETLKTGTGHNAVIPGWPAGGKTGTSQDFRDAWFIGYTSKLVTGVWLGNDDGTPMKKVTGGGLPVEVWTRYMRPVHQGVPVAALPGKPVASPATSPAVSDSLDTWLIDRLFSSR